MSTDAVRAALAELVACQDELDSTKMSMFVNSTEFARFLERNCERTEAARAAARAALSEPAPSVPDGWQLVPKEPTLEMLRAAVQVKEGPAVYKVMSFAGLAVLEEDTKDEYTAALAAAPSPTMPARVALSDEQIGRVIERHAGGCEWSDADVASAEKFARAVIAEY